jgi:hypothetical protein
MAVADGTGLPLSVHTAAAAPHEATLVPRTLAPTLTTHCPARLIGDNAYASDPLDAALAARGIAMMAPPRPPDASGHAEWTTRAAVPSSREERTLVCLVAELPPIARAPRVPGRELPGRCAAGLDGDPAQIPFMRLLLEIGRAYHFGLRVPFSALYG